VKLKSLIVPALLLLITSVPLFAHHGTSAMDIGKKVVLKGVVTDWQWQNPHSILKFDAKDDSGNIVHWSAEANNPADMVERGWSKQSIKVGDEITITVEPVKNGKPVGRILQIVFANGTILNNSYPKQ
jgi:hypothetical protein